MLSLGIIVARNNEAVLKAYREALEDEDYRLAARLVRANPDLLKVRAR
mgnify:CR=1 FL=1